MEDPINSTQIAVHSFIAVFGAITHALNAYRKGESKTLVDFIALTVMSSFSGAMFAIIGLYLFPENIHLSMAMAGSGGFIGVEGMTYVIKFVTDRYSDK